MNPVLGILASKPPCSQRYMTAQKLVRPYFSSICCKAYQAMLANYPVAYSAAAKEQCTSDRTCEEEAKEATGWGLGARVTAQPAISPFADGLADLKGRIPHGRLLPRSIPASWYHCKAALYVRCAESWAMARSLATTASSHTGLPAESASAMDSCARLTNTNRASVSLATTASSHTRRHPPCSHAFRRMRKACRGAACCGQEVLPGLKLFAAGAHGLLRLKDGAVSRRALRAVA